MDQWKMAPGILPILSCAHPTTAANLGSSSFQDSGSSFGTVPAGESEQAVHNVSQMVASLVRSPYILAAGFITDITGQSSTVTAAVDATSLTSVFLDECLHMFFVRFIPTFPVLHRATFVFRESSQPLLLNAMAIGSLYLGPKASVAKVSDSCPPAFKFGYTKSRTFRERRCGVLHILLLQHRYVPYCADSNRLKSNTLIVGVTNHTSGPIRCMPGCSTRAYGSASTSIWCFVKGEPAYSIKHYSRSKASRIGTSEQQVKRLMRLAFSGRDSAPCRISNHTRLPTCHL